MPRKPAAFPPRRAPGHAPRGITLLELVTTMAIACIGFAVGIPSYQYFVQQGHVDAARNRLVSHFASARQTALAHRRITAICPSDGPEHGCRPDRDWGQGWLMFFDPDIKTTPILLILHVLYDSRDRTYSLSYSSFGLLGVGCCGLGSRPNRPDGRVMLVGIAPTFYNHLTLELCFERLISAVLRVCGKARMDYCPMFRLGFWIRNGDDSLQQTVGNLVLRK